MRVLVINRPGDRPGGDVLTAMEYARAIGADTCGADKATEETLKQYDVVHMFAAVSPDWCLPTALRVKSIGIPLVISPLYWPRDMRHAYYKTGDVFPGYKNLVAATIAQADLLACMTMSELIECRKIAGDVRGVVMGMGQVDLLTPGMELSTTAMLDKPDYAVCIGRVEAHKNQAGLARACREIGVNLVCVGEIVDEVHAYEAESWGAKLVGHLDKQATLSVLFDSGCHALPSFGEIVARVNVEAAMLNIPAVIGWYSADPEFFGPGGVYCDPSDWRDIARAVEIAMDRPHTSWSNPIPTWSEIAGKMLPVLDGLTR